MAVLKRKLRVVGELVDQEFQQLDDAITEVLRDFVQLGQLLITMRDKQVYKRGGFDTFEDYCRAKAGLAISSAKEKIRHAMVQLVIVEDPGAEISAPETEEQVRQLAPRATFNIEERKVTTRDGIERTIKQAVGIKNPVQVANQWTKTVNEFERRKAKAEREGTKLPILSGKFVRNMLPNELKVSTAKGFNCNPCVNMAGRLSKLKEALDDQGFMKLVKLKPLLKEDPECLPPQTADLWNQCQEVRDRLTQLMEFLEPHCDFGKDDIDEFA